uniref:Carotenoid isomerase n=1 Tax=Spironucleus salmonicida TaxID=348837 RepID=V6LAR8_9EUKA|eukprot:EST41507.1 Carotenoid isomerase [Spironucleus salmonicida]
MDLGDKKTDGKHRIFKELGIDKNITFVSSNSVWDIADKENHYSIPHGLDNARNYLIEKFPHEEKGIRRYFKKYTILPDVLLRFLITWVTSSSFSSPLYTLSTSPGQ